MLNVIAIRDASKLALLSPASYYRLAGENLLPPPIKTSPNRSAVIEHELNAVLIARSTGADDQAIKQLVRELVANRKNQLDK